MYTFVFAIKNNKISTRDIWEEGKAYLGSFCSVFGVRHRRVTWRGRCGGCWRTWWRSTARWTPGRGPLLLPAPPDGSAPTQHHVNTQTHRQTQQYFTKLSSYLNTAFLKKCFNYTKINKYMNQMNHKMSHTQYVIYIQNELQYCLLRLSWYRNRTTKSK